MNQQEIIDYYNKEFMVVDPRRGFRLTDEMIGKFEYTFFEATRIYKPTIMLKTGTYIPPPTWGALVTRIEELGGEYFSSNHRYRKTHWKPAHFKLPYPDGVELNGR